MRKVATLIALGLLVATTAFAANTVRISQVYGGGGGGSTWTYDYVELFNSGPSDINIGGWSIQYGSSTGTAFGSSSTNCAFIPTGAVIPACGYYLIQVGSSGGTGVLDPWPAGGPDFINLPGPAMSATGGKVALISNSTFPTACSGNSVGGVFVDVLGFNPATTCYETTPTVALNNASVLVRNGAGMTDTDVNSADFTLTAAASVTIHNSQSAKNAACLATPAIQNTWGTIKQIYR
jgi:uncharacterized protein